MNPENSPSGSRSPIQNSENSPSGSRSPTTFYILQLLKPPLKFTKKNINLHFPLLKSIKIRTISIATPNKLNLKLI